MALQQLVHQSFPEEQVDAQTGKLWAAYKAMEEENDLLKQRLRESSKTQADLHLELASYKREKRDICVMFVFLPLCHLTGVS
jgi:hypothetical protein